MGLGRTGGAEAQQALRLGVARAENAELRRSEEERRRLLASQLTSAQRELLERRQAEMAALRLRLAALQRRADTENTSESEGKTAHASVPAAAWIYAGRDNPRAAFESVLWAASRGEVDPLVGLLGYTPEMRARADALFAQLPAPSQQEYGSPGKVIATLLAGSFPKDASSMTALGESDAGNGAALLMRVERSGGQAKSTLFQFHRAADGWQLMVPPGVMANLEKTLTGVP